MTDERIELVRGVYERWSRGELYIPDVLRPDVEIVWDAALPDLDVDRGVDAMKTAVRRWLDGLRDLTITAEEIRVEGDNVLVLASVKATGRESGLPLDAAVAHLWTFEDGGVARIEGWFDREEALRAARGGDRGS